MEGCNAGGLTGEPQAVTVLVIPRDDGTLLALHPDVLYTADEVRRALRLDDIDSVHRIARNEMPWFGIGLKRRTKRYWGRDVIEYVNRGARACPTNRTAETTTQSGAPSMASAG